MSDKVVLPRLDLPGQKTHWTVVAVIGGGVLVLLMAAIFLVVVHSSRLRRKQWSGRLMPAQGGGFSGREDEA